jgi:hypothetical protein
MKVAVWNMEPKYKNLAVEKIKMYHGQLGDEVVDYLPAGENTYDLIYCSSIFTFTDKSYVPGRAICGSTGFSITQLLPPAIEMMKPKLNFGFTTRGCFRKCPFCVVPLKEGMLQAVGDIYDFWDGKSRNIELLDNNIMGLPEHFKMIWKQIYDEKLTLREHGLDIRILDQDKAETLALLKREYHFAFDSLYDEKAVRKGIKLLENVGINRSTFYVLVGFNTTFEQDLYRCNMLRDLGQNAYVMRYIKDRKTTQLARWANTHSWFQGCTFEQFLDRPENANYKKLFC